jgi:small GTP-binding protein
MKRTRAIDNDDKLGQPMKIVLLGDGCIGKSTFFEKICKLNDKEYSFQKKYKATENFDFDRLEIKCVQGIATIDLWDTAGQESKGGKIRDAYLKGADAILLFYDISEPKTKQNITKWLEQVKQITPNIPVAVIGNKADKLEDLQQTESVKLRDCNLQRDVGHNKIKNFLISIKENIHINSTYSFLFGTGTYVELPGCLVGFEYLLSQIYKKSINIDKL